MVTTSPSHASPFVSQLKTEITYGKKGMFRKYLVKDKKRQAMLICLQTGIEIPEHMSSYDGFMMVIQGKGVFRLSGREVLLEPGVFVELPADTLHSLKVTKNLSLLKVVEHHEVQETVTSSQKSCREQPPRSKQMTCADSLAEMLKSYLEGLGAAEGNSITS